MSKLLHNVVLLAALSCATAAEPVHWAYRPLVEPAVPRVQSTNWIRNSIDPFIAATLESSGLTPSREAGRRTLLRRVYFDLIGLPPTPEETRAFISDETPTAWERVVDRLLASPRYGERWARHWMDAIHFAETHGHDQDRIRTNAWPYRDYLVESFNHDKPYPRFVQEQVAGDVLFPDNPQAVVALGLLAAGPWDESSLRDIREDTIDRQIARYLDRDDVVTTVMQTFTSTTVHCARCHNHKFDPIPQTDYYALQAVFAGVDRANRTYDANPKVHQQRMALRRERERAEKDRAWLLGSDVAKQVEEFEQAHAASQRRWKTVIPETFVPNSGAFLTLLTNGAILASEARPDRDTYTITARAPLATITALRLEVLADETLPMRGPGRQTNGNFHLSEFQMLVFEPGAPLGSPVKIASASADFNQSGWTIDHALDGKEKTAWGVHPKVGESHHAVFRFKEPLTCGHETKLTFVLKQLHGDGHLIGCLRLSATSERSPATTIALPFEQERILALPRSKRTEEEQATLAKFVVNHRIANELAALPKPSLVYAAANDFEPDGSHKPAGAPRAVHVLRRGDINRPQERAEPGALSSVSLLQSRFEIADVENEGARRTALAKWLTDPANALTWRSIVNRVWHHHFGRGLVETPNDFGKMGGAPSHPVLLDWLAVWFRDDAKGSLKALHRMIVTSATYRQASFFSVSSDSENRLLARMNRARLDADQVRDAILQISGA
ncbi:MAG TPA: DUF1549 and DUF1553 domain-containing protein, partial [Methylomirabilota bacterium]|nr:DUF1549 and DUF1553 domain-containing protein [Methylomirabilota bacterium]